MFSSGMPEVCLISREEILVFRCFHEVDKLMPDGSCVLVKGSVARVHL